MAVRGEVGVAGPAAAAMRLVHLPQVPSFTAKLAPEWGRVSLSEKPLSTRLPGLFPGVSSLSLILLHLINRAHFTPGVTCPSHQHHPTPSVRKSM